MFKQQLLRIQQHLQHCTRDIAHSTNSQLTIPPAASPPQVMDVAVMGLAGRMLLPRLAAALGAPCYWWLAATIYGLGPNLMGLAYDRLVVAAAGAGGRQRAAGCHAGGKAESAGEASVGGAASG